MLWGQIEALPVNVRVQVDVQVQFRLMFKSVFARVHRLSGCCHQRNYAVNKKHITDGQMPVDGPQFTVDSWAALQAPSQVIISCLSFSRVLVSGNDVQKYLTPCTSSLLTAYLSTCLPVCLSVSSVALSLRLWDCLSGAPWINIYLMFIGTHFTQAACLIVR